MGPHSQQGIDTQLGHESGITSHVMKVQWKWPAGAFHVSVVVMLDYDTGFSSDPLIDDVLIDLSDIMMLIWHLHDR